MRVTAPFHPRPGRARSRPPHEPGKKRPASGARPVQPTRLPGVETIIPAGAGPAASHLRGTCSGAPLARSPMARTTAHLPPQCSTGPPTPTGEQGRSGHGRDAGAQHAEAHPEQGGEPVLVQQRLEEGRGDEPRQHRHECQGQGGYERVGMSSPHLETAADRGPHRRNEEQEADEAEPEPQVEHDVMCVGDRLHLAGTGFVELELHPQSPADEQVLRDESFRLTGQVQAILCRFRLPLVVEEALERRGKRDLDGLLVHRGRYDHDRDGDRDDGQEREHHLARPDIKAPGDAVPVPDEERDHDDRHDHAEIHQHGALVGEHHAHDQGDQRHDVTEPDGPRRQPDKEAHRPNAQEECGRLRTDCTETLEREQRQVDVDVDVPDRHQVEQRRAPDAQLSEPEQVTAVEVAPHRHSRSQGVGPHDVPDGLRLVDVLRKRVVVEPSLHPADRQPGAEGQPEARRKADPCWLAPRDEAGHQRQGDIDLGEPQLRRA